MLFICAGECARVPVPSLICCFLDCGAIAQQLKCSQLTLFQEPRFWTFAHLLDEVPFQRPRGDAALLRHYRDRPVRFPREFRPVLDISQFGIHAGFFTMMSFYSAGQEIFSPRAPAR